MGPYHFARHFKLYLRTNTELFTADFKVVVVDGDRKERGYEVNRQNYFTGHVIGEDRCHSYIIIRGLVQSRVKGGAGL